MASSPVYHPQLLSQSLVNRPTRDRDVFLSILAASLLAPMDDVRRETLVGDAAAQALTQSPLCLKDSRLHISRAVAVCLGMIIDEGHQKLTSVTTPGSALANEMHAIFLSLKTYFRMTALAHAFGRIE
ncbi:hypothetical protein PSPO01_08439 [Paraphaeosphaeria sporulosa]